LEDVDKEEYRDYYKHIPYETCFLRILNRFEQNMYHSLAGMMQDFETMLYNAAEYNDLDSDIVINCKKILIHMTFIVDKLKKKKFDFEIPVFDE
jgi:hypothetical protein